MTKTDAIARRVLGWKLNRWDRWFDYERGVFINDSEFQPVQNLLHAMLIVERLEKLGYTFTSNGENEALFNQYKGTGETLAEAITNAAYAIIENDSVVTSTSLWRKLS
ncbi:BC1872 family protein [Mesobacillus subterraneus]|uniref:Phage ABA sandwich domain-containing protein n=1 Tax=Mesobacillus subterraneus TaxID=285983 RepID=A0A3R9E4J2_9BACI|nr:hypothetical protein [Mesobacillus subterraneus]RSD25922.1 hypothetical protein EJA10_16190 [Mesobacillus subterraneus]